ncbi:MAG: putative quinol monooxygenase [Xanthobacteraceae bacterium]
MRFVSLLLLVCALAPVPGQAQEVPLYVVNYIEVAPASSSAAASLLRNFANAARKERGSTRFEVLQRSAPANQFAIVSAWQDQKAYDAYLASAPLKELRDKLKSHLISAIDERTHNGLDIASGDHNGQGTVYVVTHVDVPPPKKDDCIAALKTLVAASRKEPASVRFDIFQQGSRPNHFTVVEIWKDQAAYEAHITASHTKAFRDELTPMTGALYDERLYHAL